MMISNTTTNARSDSTTTEQQSYDKNSSITSTPTMTTTKMNNDSIQEKPETKTARHSPSLSSSSPPTKASSSFGSFLEIARVLVIELPIIGLFTLLAASVIVQRVYWSYVTPIVQSYKREEMEGDWYDDYANDFTYYNRHCGPGDITTHESSDLLVREGETAEEAADRMLQHGAVAFQNVLRNETATELRQYLATKHAHRHVLGYNEVFWNEISRLSLGIGTSDHPAIAEAMQQVGNHPVLGRTLKGILGDDPAIVEISTLTSLNGADDQDIHTDSDWFGSSLLYSRNFLHSYSLFIALQDTSKDLGATTVCPGTHYCADIDLEELCLNHGAFEVSTNGHTGEDGLLRKGDAFMFNQNIWHRGPANVDSSGLDRTMFIMTFASAKDVAADRRRQGLGTYYYQRFNMWGSTFSMLKDATRTMIQPFGFFRALGLVKTRGVTWIHQFAQQFANSEEFYDDYLLEEFQSKVLDHYNVPRFLRSESDSWEQFIPETMALWVAFLAFINVTVMAFYTALAAVVCLFKQQTLSQGLQSNKRLFLALGSVGLIATAFSRFVDRTDLAKSVTTGDVFVKPFPTIEGSNSIAANYGPTTFPERNDVLIATRFDAPFLASFNRFLNFHPGNRRWDELVTLAATLPDGLVPLAAENIVRSTLQYKEAGLSTRFLLQNPYTGAWTIMSDAEALKETRRAVMNKSNPLVGALSQYLKFVVADARFGSQRETVMTRVLTEVLVNHQMALLYGENDSQVPFWDSLPQENAFHKVVFALKYMNIQQFFQWSLMDVINKRQVLEQSPLQSLSDEEESEANDNGERDDTIRIGDKTWVFYGDNEVYEGVLLEVLENDRCLVFLFNSGFEDEVHIDALREYVQLKEGDRVAVEDSGEFFEGNIASIHPDGRCGIQFDYGDFVNKIGREYIFLL